MKNIMEVCFLCSSPIKKIKNIYKLSCCGYSVHKKCLEKYIRDSIISNKKISCPNCLENIKFDEKVYPNSTLAKQFLSIELTPLDESFALQDDMKIEIQNNFIEELKIDLKSYGFSGSVKFNLRLKYYKTKLLSFLKDKLPVQIKIIYEQIKLEDKSIKNNLKVIGFIDAFGEDGIEEIVTDFTLKANGGKTEQKYNPGNSQFRLKFIDPLKYFLSEHKQIKIYLDDKYDNLLKTHISDLKADSYINAEVDSGFKELTQKKPLIMIPGNTSYYDFWIHTINSYGGYLMYDPEKNEYKIINTKKPEESKEDDIKIADKAYINSISKKFIRCYNTALEILNGISTEAEKYLLNTNNRYQKKAVFKAAQIKLQNYTSLFEKYTKNEEKKFIRKFSYEAEYVIKYKGFSFNLPKFTNNEIKFKAASWNNSFGEKDFSVNLKEISFIFKRYSTKEIFWDFRSEKELNDETLKKRLAPQTDENSRGIIPFLRISTNYKGENYESSYSWLPNYRKPDYPVIINGVISVPDNVLQKYSSKVPYMIFDGFSTNPADNDTEKKDNNAETFSLSELPEHFLAYRVKLPVFKENSDVIISVPYIPNLQNERLFNPLCYNHPVRVAIYQESAHIVEIPQYVDNTLIDKEKQMNNYYFGPENQAKLYFEENSKDQIFAIEKNNESGKTNQKVIINNESIKITYSDEN